MAKYTFSLKLKESNDEFKYSVDLQPQYENQPEHFFNSQVREKIGSELQKQSACSINEANLTKIINTWMRDIKEGYRNSNLTLDLPLLIQAGIANLNELGNQEIPSLITPDLSNVEFQIGALPPLIFT